MVNVVIPQKHHILHNDIQLDDGADLLFKG